MKKLFALLITLLLAFAISCGGQTPKADSGMDDAAAGEKTEEMAEDAGAAMDNAAEEAPAATEATDDAAESE